MNEEMLKSIAGQLRKPQGARGVQMGVRMNEGNLYINRFTIEALQLMPSDNVLEIGMGNGFLVKDILSINPSIRYTGCDFSEQMVEEACKHNQDFIESGHCKIYLASADKLPVEDKLFDKVFTVNTLYFWEQPDVVLAEIWRVLRLKGQLVIALRPKRVMENYPFTKYGFSMYSKDDVIELLSTNNFKVVSILEKEEPDQEINGEKIRVETLLVSARKV